MTGRPPIEITNEILVRTRSLASRGLTNEQIANCLGWHVSTLQAKKAEFKEFSEAVDEGKSKGLADITNALYESALKGNYQSIQFYLKNRDNINWNDRKTLELSGELTLKTAEEWAEELE
jgi:hypothetical protein